MNKIYTLERAFNRWRSLQIICLLITFAVFLGTTNVNAQVSSYTFSQTSGSFTEIAGGTVLGTATANTVAGSLDTAAFPVTLPFAFNFNGASYNDVSVNTNGYITFGTLASTGSAPISATTAWGGVASAWGGDLNSVFDIAGKTGEMRWETIGTAPNRQVVFQWKFFRPAYTISTTAAYAFSFQIVLEETTNKVSSIYTAGSYLVGNTSVSGTRQIGLRGATNADFNNRTNVTTANFDTSTAGTLNSSSQAFNTLSAPPGMPFDGLTYTWTPPTCFSPSGPFNYSAITTNSATMAFVASSPIPSNGYEIYYSPSNTAPTSSTVLDATNSVTSMTATANISGISPSTVYYVWVRSKCSATETSGWLSAGSFNTLCVPATAPYIQNFDTTPVGSTTNTNAPICWSYLETAGFAGYGYVTTGSAVSPSNNYYLQNSTATTGSQMLVSPQTTNLSDGTKWTKFSAKAGASTGYTLEVGTMSDPTDPTTFTLLGTPITLTTTHTVYSVIIPSGTNQYLAFRHGMGGTSRSIYIDDIKVENVPTCWEPTSVSVTGHTSSSGTLSWTAPTAGNPVSYTVYYSTSSTAPTASTVLTSSNSATFTSASGTITGLNPSTNYFVWVRTNCSGTDFSVWTPTFVSFSTDCQPPAITGTTGQTVCPNATATLSATAGSGATINWYDAATGGTLLATGSSYTTPALVSTTNYYVTASVGSSAPGGKMIYSPNPSSGAGTTNFGLVFDVIQQATIQSVTIYPVSSTNASGTVVVDVIDGTGAVVQSATFNVTGAPISALVPQVLNLNFVIPVGTNYKMRPGSFTGISGLAFDPSANAPAGNYGYPFVVPGILSINTSTLSAAPANTARNDLYYYFYNWQVSTKCESATTMVTATVDSACMATSEVENIKEIKIYPNPFTDFITISEAKDVSTVQVIDISGRLVKTITKPARQINLQDLKSGMYLLKFEFKDGATKIAKAIKK